MGKKVKKNRQKKRKNLKRKNPQWLSRKENAAAVESSVQESARLLGFDTRVSVVTSGKTKFFHWIFDSTSWRIHFWPTSGRWSLLDGSDNEGIVQNPEDILPVLVRFAAVEIETGWEK